MLPMHRCYYYICFSHVAFSEIKHIFLFAGIGVAMFFVSFFVSIYYNVIIAWAFFLPLFIIDLRVAMGIM